MNIRERIYELHLQELADNQRERYLAMDGEGQGMDNIPNCPTRGRATVLIEHEFTPQLRLKPSETEEPEHERTVLTCEWCNSEIDPRDVSERAPRKPAASSGWEPEVEWIRRRA